MIDKNGKLFGIVNAIDLLTVIVVIGVVVFFIKRNDNQDVVEVATQSVQIKVYAEGVSDFITDYISIDDRLEDSDRNLYLGKISEVNISDGYMYIHDKDGGLNKTNKEGYKSIELVSTVDAQVSENGITIDGNKYGVGHSFSAIAGKGKILVKISALEVLKK